MVKTKVMRGEVLDVAGASELLRVSIWTIRQKAKAGEIPARKVGREWRFSRKALLGFLERGRNEPVSRD